MFESLKIWAVEVAMKKMLPSMVRACIMALIGYLAAHHGLLNALGVTWDDAGHSINIDLDMLSKYALIAIPGLVTAIIAGLEHHTTAAMSGAPQTGDLRTLPQIPIEGGDRKEDPKEIKP